MKHINCYWEKENIGRTTVEIVIDHRDIFNEKAIADIESQYEYVVIKVPMNMSKFNFGLSKMGYTLTEVQCKLYKDYNSFDFDNRIIQRILPHVSFKKIGDRDQLANLVDRITSGMFSTDRISIDPYYGLDKACQRYRNWVSSSFNEHKADFLFLEYDNKEIGFSMYKEDGGGNLEMILGGVFEEFQSRGIGILTPTRHFLYAYQTGALLKKVTTTISSNNTPVWRIYNYFDFKIESLHYVFIKHNQIDIYT